VWKRSGTIRVEWEGIKSKEIDEEMNNKKGKKGKNTKR